MCRHCAHVCRLVAFSVYLLIFLRTAGRDIYVVEKKYQAFKNKKTDLDEYVIDFNIVNVVITQDTFIFLLR